MVECSGLENPDGKPQKTAKSAVNCGLNDTQDATFTNRSAGREVAKVGTVDGPNFSALELALMDEAVREFWLRMPWPGKPTEDQIAEALSILHEGAGQSGTRVYFIQRGTDGYGPIKIGVAKNVKRRLASLKTASAEPLFVLAICRGDRAMERQYHDAFAKFRLSGEWFRPEPEILAEIDRLRGCKLTVRQ